MAAEVAWFGIRHHGPGSARRLLEALADLRPAEVLIEGPADLSDQLPRLADEAMVPPVALLAYPKDQPEQAIFWPFAVYSPEYQAARWAIREGVPVRFIDLPVAWRLQGAEPDGGTPDQENVAPIARRVAEDPIGVLALAAGYEDGESWWRDVIEENPDPGPIFAAVDDAMTALREEPGPLPGLEAAREAHMRLEIARSAKAATGPVAVVCGAWHVPGLKARHPLKDDRDLLKGAPKVRITATWAPWTSPRLAYATGYGAGVAAPGWCLHLWETPGADQATRWLARIAAALRSAGHLVSTASLIEAERLARAIAAVRGRPRTGFEELREAVIACLCFGDPILWRSIEAELLLGSAVGAIPANVPAAPLLEDLQRQQAKARLKPEALERELSLDLRSESGLFRSTLLHRLHALEVPWGRLGDAGRSRGTFRERWTLAWQPEFAVQLVENLVYGTTIEAAAAARITRAMREAATLGALSDLVFTAMTAQLDWAAAAGIERLAERAAQTSDCLETLGALPGLADLIRYGKARRTDAGQLATLFARIGTQGALALDYASRNLDADAARGLAGAVKAADGAVRLAGVDGGLQDVWMAALRRVTEDRQGTPLVTGTAARLLYESGDLSPDEAVILLTRMLSPGTAPANAAAYFEGFFEGAGQRILYDAALRETADLWMQSLDEQVFTEYLPVFRRVFSALDRTERRRLFDALFGRQADGGRRVLSEQAETLWPAHFKALIGILRAGGSDDR